MNKNTKMFGVAVLAMIAIVAIAAVLSVSATTVVNDEVVAEVSVFESPVAEEEVSSLLGTNVEWHGEVDILIKRAGSDEWELVVDNEPNLLTNIGGHFIRMQLNGSNATLVTIANLSLSNDGGAASNAWTELPAEITTNGLDRATAAAGLVNNGSIGAFNITHTWTASDSQSCQLIGTHWSGSDGKDGNLFSAIKFAQQSLLVNDQLQAIYSVTMS